MPVLGIIASSASPNAFANSYESIATINGTGSSGSIVFSSIPSTYTHLQLRVSYQDTTASSFQSQSLFINGDSAANYSWHYVLGDGATTYSNPSVSASNILGGQTVLTNNSNYAVSIIDILDYANTNKYKTTRGLYGNDQNGSGRIQLVSGAWRNTAAITSLTISTPGNFTTASKFALYGIKG
jgi:hypothetical protein